MDCQKAHRKRHKKACKQRAAALKDEELYGQGHERPEGDFCPICTLPIPLPMHEHSSFNVCCMKRICKGCNFAAQKRGMHDCAFCRTPLPDNDAELVSMIRARVEKKDPEAIYVLGDKYRYGDLGLQKDMRKAAELYAEAAELGSVEGLFKLKQRAADLKDEQLYNQGHERPEGDFCPICTLPIELPMDDHSVLSTCCMKRICNGCNLIWLLRKEG